MNEYKQFSKKLRSNGTRFGAICLATLLISETLPISNHFDKSSSRINLENFHTPNKSYPKNSVMNSANFLSYVATISIITNSPE